MLGPLRRISVALLPRTASQKAHPATMEPGFGFAPAPAPGLVLDSVSVLWLVFAIVWTSLLIAGMIYLYSKRRTPSLRLRSLNLCFAAIIFLHIYWVAVQLGYIYGPLMPDSLEFWIMSLYLPFGMALFHASNSQFLHISKAQRRFIQRGSVQCMRRKAKPNSRLLLFARLKRMDYATRIILYVSAGMAVQVSFKL
jgi:hypothetical protein